jgi:hypothetical protein
MQQREQMRRNLEWFAKWIGKGSEVSGYRRVAWDTIITQRPSRFT